MVAEGTQTPLSRPSQSPCRSPCPFPVPTSASTGAETGPRPGLAMKSHSSQRTWKSSIYTTQQEIRRSPLFFFNNMVYFTQVMESTIRPAFTTFLLLGVGARVTPKDFLFSRVELAQKGVISKARGPED